jgi:hypothetical protein
MRLTNKQIQLAQTIDNWAKTIEKQGGGDIDILQDGLSQMATFKELLDTTSHDQLDKLCEMYSGFYRFAKLIEFLSQGVHDGTIKVPNS